MDKCFWEMMTKAWCKNLSDIDADTILETAAQHAAKDRAQTSGYALNPLDDDDWEDD